jgi:pyruvate formate lyase activating enzyme
MVNKPEPEGIIFKIKRFSIHDGPGIRTSVFLKGCPLNCVWCHSPEGISKDVSIWYNRNLCIACSQCVKACPNNALELTSGTDQFIYINHVLCNTSGNCVRVCPTHSIQYTGYETNVSGIIKEVEKDMLYYRNSGGGVTITGGEPLFQPEFLAGILQACRKRKIHTAVETSLYCEKETLDLLADWVDLFIADIKFFDTALHRHYTGKDNETIKTNFTYLAKNGKNILVRIPLIDNITNTKANLNAIRKFVSDTRNDILIEEIANNPLAENSYLKLGIPFLLK